jgi:phenylalanyl-tRNA synthetase alpha chain
MDGRGVMNLRLSRAELKTLKSLREAGGRSTAAQLVERGVLDRSSLMSTFERLSSKGLIELRRIEDELLELTPEGLSYAERGLPERRLYEAVKLDPTTPAELGVKLGLDERMLSIALGWAKRKGWVKVEGGLVKALRPPELDEDEIALRELAKRGPLRSSHLEVSAECIKRLKERSLISSKPLVEIEARLTDSGLALSEAPEALVEVGSLTPDLLKTGAWTTAKFKPYDVTGRAIHSLSRQKASILIVP